MEDPQRGSQGEAIAVTEKLFEMLAVKGVRFRFRERSNSEYDLEMILGRAVVPCSREHR